MLEDLKKYDNLGTPEYFWEFFQQLKNEDLWTEKDITSYFFNKVIDWRSIFDGCIPLLKLSNIISINDETNKVEKKFTYRNILHSKQLCKQKLLEWFLLALHKDNIFYDILSSKNSSYDIVYKTVQIDFSAFWLKYSNIRKLLLDFDFLVEHPDFPQNKLIINPGWKKFFDKNFAPEIRKRKVWIDELKQALEQQQINWEIAEEFILKFENKRLNFKDWIEWIAPYDSKAWYDILSFNNNESQQNDRYIEVKSYIWDTPYFYWTDNEMKTAKRQWNKYFLYLVNREKINEEDYIPEIICNPCINILENNIKWDKEVNKYFITKIQTS